MDLTTIIAIIVFVAFVLAFILIPTINQYKKQIKVKDEKIKNLEADLRKSRKDFEAYKLQNSMAKANSQS